MTLYVFTEICGFFNRVVAIWAAVNACIMYKAECFDQAAFFMALAAGSEAAAWGVWIYNQIKNGKEEEQ